MQITFVGTGDAFGSGGRFNTCFHVATEETRFLIDCGASSMIALKAMQIDRTAIDTIFITHFHGDHFGGLPYFMLDAQFFAKRRAPLTIVGPEGLQKAFVQVMETAFAGSSGTVPKFDLQLIELQPGEPLVIGSVTVKAARVRHGPVDGPFLAYRFEVEGKRLAYTGDTEWVDTLYDVCSDADCLIAEAYFFEKKVPFHLDLVTLGSHLPRLAPKRLILTHMNEDMLSRDLAGQFEKAEDGLVISL